MKVIKSKELSSAYEPRFVVVDENTGEVLDDAQGYGYRSAENAHRAWAYKTNKKTRKRIAKRKKQEKRFERWWDRHPEFRDRVEQMMFYAIKDEAHGIHHAGEELYEACASVAKEMGIEDFRKEML